MATSNKTKIREYCDQHGIFVPVGFERRSASRYAIIRRDLDPPKLVATTWFNQKDAVYFIENTLIEEIKADINDVVDILDFKDAKRFLYRASGALEQDGTFSLG
ncbi:hypothetical protein [Roseibacillus persicicus]|uniref:hypothetical protein n=1 Tax=Roseibacillus persicicus TaxID=454148 RepID=UPI00280E5297|nr:hypothetical protein [Roseibacillus persicicus]MDQ8192751.1 hypothetical protein [Roseibacillus persicicus]